MPVVRELVTLFRAKTDKRAFSEAEKITNNIKSVATAAAAAFTANEFFRGFNAMVQVASDATERLNVLEVGFGDNTDAIRAWSQQVATSVGRSRADIEDFVGISQAMLSAMLGNADAAESMSKEITKLSVDLGSFFNIADEEAFVALRAGLSGETEPLKRFGIVMTQAALDAFSLAEGTGKAVAEMTEAEKVQTRFNFIMSRTAKVQGDATRTAGSLANVQKALGGAFTDLQEDLGKFFLPAVTELKQETLDMVRAIGRWIKQNQALLRQRIGKFMAGFVALARGVAAAVGRIVQSLRQFWESLTEGEKLFLKIRGAAMALGAVMGIAFAPAILALSSLFLIADDIATFFTGGKSITGLIVKGFNELADEFTVFDSIRTALASSFEEIRRLFNTMVQGLMDTWNAFTTEGFTAGLKQMVVSAGKFLGQLAAVFVKGMLRVFDILVAFFDNLKGLFSGDLGLADVWESLKATVSDVTGAIGEGFAEEFAKNTPQIRALDGATRGALSSAEQMVAPMPRLQPIVVPQSAAPIDITQNITGPVDADMVGKATKIGIRQGMQQSGFNREMQILAPAVSTP